VEKRPLEQHSNACCCAALRPAETCGCATDERDAAKRPHCCTVHCAPGHADRTGLRQVPRKQLTAAAEHGNRTTGKRRAQLVCVAGRPAVVDACGCPPSASAFSMLTRRTEGARVERKSDASTAVRQC